MVRLTSDVGVHAVQDVFFSAMARNITTEPEDLLRAAKALKRATASLQKTCAYLPKRVRPGAHRALAAPTIATIAPTCGSSMCCSARIVNPRGYVHATGFWHGASARMTDMLLLRDVSEPEKEH